MKATHVKALPEYNISVAFDDGLHGIIDFKELVSNGIFQPLKDEKVFSGVYTTGYSIAWSDELEIDALTIYAELLNKHPEAVLKTGSYASN
jgi:hypothetical protein